MNQYKGNATKVLSTHTPCYKDICVYLHFIFFNPHILPSKWKLKILLYWNILIYITFYIYLRVLVNVASNINLWNRIYNIRGHFNKNSANSHVVACITWLMIMLSNHVTCQQNTECFSSLLEKLSNPFPELHILYPEINKYFFTTKSLIIGSILVYYIIFMLLHGNKNF